MDYENDGEDFESSYSPDIADMSVSSKKKGY